MGCCKFESPPGRREEGWAPVFWPVAVKQNNSHSQFLQRLHFKQHYPCSASHPCPGECLALNPECTKVFEGQSSVSSTVPTLCLFGIGLKRSELCSFEPPNNLLDHFQHLYVVDSLLCQIALWFGCDTAAWPCWSGTGCNECLQKVQRWFDGGHLSSTKRYITCKTSLMKCFKLLWVT